MAYVELHGAIRHHYKTNRLMKTLKVSRREAVGIVCTLSSWAIDNRPGGVIEVALIPDAIEWDGEGKVLIDALVDAEAVNQGLSGWLDDLGEGRVKVHDWEAITRGYRKAKEDAAERTRKARIARGEIPPDPEEPLAQPSMPDRSSSPEAKAADEYLRWNKNCTMRRDTVVWEFKKARKAAALAGDTGFMERLLAACMDQKQAENVGVWDLLKSLMPKSREENKADELIAKHEAQEKAIKKHFTKGVKA